MFYNTKLSTENYDSLLIGWSKHNLHINLSFGGGYSQFCEGKSARDKIISKFSWKITDGGIDPECSSATNDLLLNKIIIYPNPTQQDFIINFSNFESEAEITLYDLTGNQLFKLKKHTNDKTLNVKTENLNPGLYLIKINSAIFGISHRKIIINNSFQ